ncbi:FG-GAP repeat domain-containing protein [Embleya sp. NBC_00896]|uniref:FG-GAP repeat domain-containing protein n=1 Tax=Embleya sp. NBC_00896 TaxID=2975961 RepID=UPI0038684158|nr:VCBS repeat-containing protein [Embleya sp. NBC_00896]
MQYQQIPSRFGRARRLTAVAGVFGLSAGLLTVLPSVATASAKTQTAAPTAEAGVKPDEGSALKAAKSSGKRVEVGSLRSETAQTFANPSGTLTMEQSLRPVRTKQNGKWVAIDPTLRAGADGTVAPVATAAGLRFSGGGSAPLATIDRNGREISLSWPDPLPKPVLAGTTATYPEVLPGVDLQVAADVDGFSHLLVVKNAAAATNPRLKTLTYTTKTKNVTLKAGPGGVLSGIDETGQEAFTAPQARMWDSTRPTQAPTARTAGPLSSATPAEPSDAPSPNSAAMPVKVTGDILELTPDQGLLTSPTTTFPVFIDPPVYPGKMQAWTTAYKPHPNANYWNGAGFDEGDGDKVTKVARVGYENSTGGTAHSFFQLDSRGLWDKEIIKSQFIIKQVWSYSCTKTSVEVWDTGTISTATTWNNEPHWDRKVDSTTESKGWGANCPSGDLVFTVTDAAQDAATNHWNAWTLGMKATNESDPHGWKKFQADTAVMSTEYNSTPEVPYGLSTDPDAGCDGTGVVGDTTVSLRAHGWDPDGGPVTLRFRLWPSGQAIREAGTVDVPNDSYGTLPIESEDLPTGRYTWDVRAEDGRTASAWSTRCTFRVDRTRPSNPPGVSSPQYPDGSAGWPADTPTSGTEGTFTFTNGGITDVVKYLYTVDGSPDGEETVDAGPGGSAAVKLTPTGNGPRYLRVQSMDAAGNRSDIRAFLFYVNCRTDPATGGCANYKAGDVTGDDKSDIYAVTPDGDLRIYNGKGDGNLGIQGDGSTDDYTGVQTTHRGDWNNDGTEDLLARRKNAEGSWELWMHPNLGNGYACWVCSTGAKPLKTWSDDDSDPATNDSHWRTGDAQVLAVGNVTGDDNYDGLINAGDNPDLIVRAATGVLYLYPGSGISDMLGDPIVIGEDGWEPYRILAPGDVTGDGIPDLFATHTTDGQFYLYPLDRWIDTNGAPAYHHGTRTLLGNGWSTTAIPLLTAPGDANGDGKADLWSTDNLGNMRFHNGIDATGLGPWFKEGSGWQGYQTIA